MSTNLPSQIQLSFSLRDESGRSFVIPAADLRAVTRIFEVGPGLAGWSEQNWALARMEEIDYDETSFFVHSTENFELEVVFVLDFTPNPPKEGVGLAS